ncbi:MAG: hypothetical protein WC804_06360 [Sphingomonas sp.]|jgi:hypothetical protein
MTTPTLTSATHEQHRPERKRHREAIARCGGGAKTIPSSVA